MKRFAPLLLIVLALAAVPAALADDAAPAAPARHAPAQLQLLRLRLQVVRLRYRIVCHKQAGDACTQFVEKAVDGLTKLDQNVQDRISKNCTSTSTDKRCDVLAKLDQRLKGLISKLGSGPSSSESGLDNAAGSLAGSTKP